MRSGIGNSSGDPIFTSTVGAAGTISPSGTPGEPVNTVAAPFSAGTDRSGTAGTTSAQLAASNNARRGLNIQNVSANVIGVNEFGGVAAIGSSGTYTIAAGASLSVRTSRQINVIASAAASPYTATEF